MKSRGWGISVGLVLWIVSLFYWSGCSSRRIGIVKCGNNIAEEGEACDGTDLRGETCFSQGYESGTLACLPDCSGYDTSGCSISALFTTIMSTGGSYTCAVKSNGTAWCWGKNIHGQLGDGTNYDRNTPLLVVGLTGVAKISGGVEHTCAVKNDGTAWCWGYNWHGQLGDGTNENRYHPVEVIWP